jgi:hypothetical protein
MFYIWAVTRKLQPRFIIESGVWKGATTWLLEQADPDARVVAIDPALNRRKYISQAADYRHTDFGEQRWHLDPATTLVFFDDHQNALRRVAECARFGFRHLLFDDNYPELCGRRHLTLEACLTGSSATGYSLPVNADSALCAAIRTYQVLPPIAPHSEPVTVDRSRIEGTPLMAETTGNLSIYAADMPTYRWTTYVEIDPAAMPAITALEPSVPASPLADRARSALKKLLRR